MRRVEAACHHVSRNYTSIFTSESEFFMRAAISKPAADQRGFNKLPTVPPKPRLSCRVFYLSGFFISGCFSGVPGKKNLTLKAWRVITLSPSTPVRWECVALGEDGVPLAESANCLESDLHRYERFLCF